jgi:hypothetical protein
MTTATATLTAGESPVPTIASLRKEAAAAIDRLIAFLDATEPDADLEPSLGFSNGGHYPENQPQEGDAFHSYWDAGLDHEDEHDGAEPSEDSEASLGWTSHDNQASAAWQANHLGTVDLEQGVGAVRKKRPASKTGGKVVRGVEVFA